MSPKLKRLAVVIGLGLLSVGGVRTIYPSNSQQMTLRPLALNPDNLAERQVGDLEFLAAWELRSRNEDFGGISALAVLKDGRFIGVGDAGTLIGFGLTGRIAANQSFIRPLPNLQGPNRSYKDRDSESIAFDPASGQYWVGFEQKHAIRRYSKSFARQTGLRRPREMQDWPDNKGAEAIIRLSDGRFIVIAESIDGGTHPALLFAGDPTERAGTTTAFRFRPPTGYRVTDGVELPDGRIAILNRAIGFPHGFTAKVSLIGFDSINRDALVSADVIASLAPPLLVDNMEGIAVTREADETILWLISDNNFSIFQRTILMKFRLSQQPDSKKPETSTAPGL